MDFLKNFPFVTKDEYMWKWTVPQVKLASADYTHINYLTEKQVEARKAKRIDGNMPMNDLGIPVFN